MYRDTFSTLTTIIVYLCLVSSVFPIRGCGDRVELSVDHEGIEASIKTGKQRIVSEAAFRPSLEQLAGAISINAFGYRFCSDFTVYDDKVIMARDEGAISAFQGSSTRLPTGYHAIGNLTTPGIPQKVFYDGNLIKVLCDGAWYQTIPGWGKDIREYIPQWMEPVALPEGVQEVREINDGNLLYIYSNGEMGIYGHFDIQKIPSQFDDVVDALLIGKSRLIVATRNNGIYLHYSYSSYKDKKTIRIARGFEPTCLLFDDSHLFVGDANGMIHRFKPPDSWAEESEWKETGYIHLDGSIARIHPIQLDVQRGYIVSFSDSPCVLIGYDKDNNLSSGGTIRNIIPREPAVLGPCLKFVTNSKGVVYALGADGTLNYIYLKLDSIKPPEYKPPAEDGISSGVSIDPQNPPTYSPAYAPGCGKPIKNFDPGFKVNELDLIKGKLVSRGYTGLAIYDISVPDQPELETTYLFESPSRGDFIDSKPGLFVTGIGYEPIRIYDIFKPGGDKPEIVASIDPPDNRYFNIAYEANNVVLVFFSYGPTQFFDISDPLNPMKLGELKDCTILPGAFGNEVAYDNGLFYTYAGVIYEINPLAEGGAQIVRTFKTGSSSMGALFVKSGYIFHPASQGTSWLRKLTETGWVDVNFQYRESTNSRGRKRLDENHILVGESRDVIVYDIGGLPDLKPVIKITADDAIQDVLICNEYIYCALLNTGIAIYQSPLSAMRPEQD